jgi:hypothetical protein
MAETKTDNVILVPKDYTDGILEHPHQAVKGEAVVTCNLAVKDPQKLIGQKQACGGCGTVFDIKTGGA